MSFSHWNLRPGPFYPRAQSDDILTDDESSGLIRNFVLTRQGTLRTVNGPAQYHPRQWVDNGGQDPAGTTAYAAPIDGLFHCIANGRDILLYVGKIGGTYGVWSHHGWELDWELLLADNSSAAYRIKLESGTRPQFLTQFVATPTSVIIIPQGSRAFRYDGYSVSPLGYATRPAPPTLLGPMNGLADAIDNAGGDVRDTTNEGYHVDGRTLPPALGNCRLGTIRIPNTLSDAKKTTLSTKKTNVLGGVLELGHWRGRIQNIDSFGDLSPLSPPSNQVTFPKDENLSKDRKKDEDEHAARMRRQIAWDFRPGRDGTVGRILYRTKDLANSGDPRYYEVSDYATEGSLRFATIPDNITGFYPDNIPDGWLFSPPIEVDRVPQFRIGALSMGVMWIANMSGAEGALRPSLPGRFGTFPVNETIYPDSTGTEITALHAVKGGLLAFTETSTFFITPNDEGNGYKVATLHNGVGCVGPDAIATLPDGTTLWLSREGFHAHKNGAINDISYEIKHTISRINRVARLRACAAVDPRMGEFRCWVPVDGSATNNLCLVYDSSAGWRERDDVAASAVCVTRDNRAYMLAAGVVDVNFPKTSTTGTITSVWALDHEDRGQAEAQEHAAVLETAWLRSSRSHRRGSPKAVFLWLREAGDDTVNVTVDVMRDWRETPVMASDLRQLRSTSDDVPLRYNEALLAGSRIDPMLRESTPHTFRQRRMFWTKVPVEIPSCEVFKLRITVTGDFEFLGFEYEEKDSFGGGARTHQGRADR